jgi:hypothetical protein
MKIQNVVHLAAELASTPGASSFRAAALATELCHLGARYFRLSERLCGGEEEWGPYPGAKALIERTERARERLLERAVGLLCEAAIGGEIEIHDLGFGLKTRAGSTLCR